MYKLYFQKKAEIFLKKIDKFERNKILKKILELKQNPQIGKPLIGKLTGLFRLRIKNYRIIYQIIENKLIISVIKIGLRKNIY